MKTINHKNIQLFIKQTQIHTGFHCFTEISQIFQNDSETKERGL